MVYLSQTKHEIFELKGNAFRFYQQFCRFTERYALLNTRKMVVLVSGGVDSMVLAYLVGLLCNKNKLIADEIKVVYFDHQTRDQTKEEASLIANFAKTLGLSFEKVELIGLSLEMPNFEAKARDARERWISRIDQETTVLQGHHLDDSFEWHLMQKFRQSSLTACKGIPMRSGKKIRPMLCFSKGQIRYFAQEKKIPYYEDQSNYNIKFERNFLRKMIIPQIKRKHPQYLKHYIEQMEYLKETEEVFRFDKWRFFSLYQNGGMIRIELSPDFYSKDKTKIKSELLKNYLIRILSKLNLSRFNFGQEWNKRFTQLHDEIFGYWKLQKRVHLTFEPGRIFLTSHNFREKFYSRMDLFLQTKMPLKAVSEISLQRKRLTCLVEESKFGLRRELEKTLFLIKMDDSTSKLKQIGLCTLLGKKKSKTIVSGNLTFGVFTLGDLQKAHRTSPSTLLSYLPIDSKFLT